MSAVRTTPESCPVCGGPFVEDDSATLHTVYCAANPDHYRREEIPRPPPALHVGKLVEFLTTVASLPLDDELPDGWTNDDAWSTLQELIDTARLLANEEHILWLHRTEKE